MMNTDVYIKCNMDFNKLITETLLAFMRYFQMMYVEQRVLCYCFF